MNCSIGRCNIKHLSLCIHNHQPVGNFGNVFEEALAHAYVPFLQTLMDFPKIRISLHTSGPLLEYIERHNTAYLDLVRELVARGQVEPVGGVSLSPFCNYCLNATVLHRSNS